MLLVRMYTGKTTQRVRNLSHISGFLVKDFFSYIWTALPGQLRGIWGVEIIQTAGRISEANLGGHGAG
jgi:hypothetical protein